MTSPIEQAARVAGIIADIIEGKASVDIHFDITNADAVAKSIIQALSDAGMLVGGWRTMESAPRDGTRILATDPFHNYVAVMVSDGPEWAICNHRGSPIGIGFYPGYWLPLPAAPQSTGGGE